MRSELRKGVTDGVQKPPRPASKAIIAVTEKDEDAPWLAGSVIPSRISPTQVIARPHH